MLNATAVLPHAAPSLLDEFMADLQHAPDPLLLSAMDLLRAHRQSLNRLAATRTSDLEADSP